MRHFLILLSLAVTLPTSNAHASYFRFWQGTQRSDLTTSQFESGLNELLLPATGKLATTPAKLLTYHPVLLSPIVAKQLSLPNEIALVEYADEDSYRAYRQTSEGKAYGDLHWELFDQSKSQSLVPENFQGAVAFDKAYKIETPTRRWDRGSTFFQIIMRDSSASDEVYLAKIQDYVEHVTSQGSDGLILIVTRSYLMAYSLWPTREAKDESDRIAASIDSISEFTKHEVVNLALQSGTFLRPMTGVRYDIAK